MIFIETSTFSRIVQTLLTDEEYRDFDGIYLPKGETGRLDARTIEASAQDYRRGTAMNDEMFAELEASLKEGMAILRGENPPARVFEYGTPDVKSIRKELQLTQHQFAVLMGISVRTLQNWEQKRRVPEGPARVLLMVAARHPQVVLDVVRTGAGN